jgi:hypothetical protein
VPTQFSLTRWPWGFGEVVGRRLIRPAERWYAGEVIFELSERGGFFLMEGSEKVKR